MRCPQHDVHRDDFPLPRATNNLAAVQADPKGGTCYYCFSCYKYKPNSDDILDSSTVRCQGCGTDSVFPTSILDDQGVLSRAGVSQGSELLHIWYQFSFGGGCTCPGSSDLLFLDDSGSVSQDTFQVLWQEFAAVELKIQRDLESLPLKNGDVLMDAITDIDYAVDDLYLTGVKFSSSVRCYADSLEYYRMLSAYKTILSNVLLPTVRAALQRHMPKTPDEAVYIRRWLEAEDFPQPRDYDAYFKC